MRSLQVSSFDEAAAILLRGGIGVLPTDTVYGLVASAADKDAVGRLYDLKKRERKPGPIIAASAEQLVQLGVPEQFIEKVRYLWPNPISVVLPLGAELEYLHQGVGEQPFRVVADDHLRHFLQRVGPLVASSANQPGEPTSTTLAEAWNYFGDTVDFYVDGGDLSNRPPSTIVRLDGEGLKVLRQGAMRLPD